MSKAIGLAGAAVLLTFAGGANAHTLQLDCHKTTGDTVVCRTVLSGGEVLRDVAVELVGENDQVIATGKTDVRGLYTFQAPGAEYNVVVQANKAHVASMSSLDIW